MKKLLYLLAAGLFLTGLAACAAKPEEPASTTVTTSAEINETELYEEFLESREWALMEDGAGDLSEWDFELAAQKIFDFDGDGVDELWIEASEPGGFDLFSGLYTIESAQVKELLSGYVTGGSIGGNCVVAYYDTQTQQHIVSLVGYAGGIGGGGGVRYGTYYEYENGQLREVLDLKLESLYGREPVYTVNGEQVTEEKYNQTLARLTKPTDETFLLGKNPLDWE